MRINILQHTPNEGPGMIMDWAHEHQHQVYTYHPYQFGHLPTSEQTDLLIILGGPMSPNDSFPWITQEQRLIDDLLKRNIPIFGACFGAQQIVKALGYQVLDAPAKEVGWGPVTRQTAAIPNLPAELTVLHWHEQMFEIPANAELLFSSPALKNQGFVLGHQAVGLQFHLEPAIDNINEMVVNDFPYIQGSIFKQSPQNILEYPIPPQNRHALFQILDYLAEP